MCFVKRFSIVVNKTDTVVWVKLGIESLCFRVLKQHKASFLLDDEHAFFQVVQECLVTDSWQFRFDIYAA